MVPGHRLQRLLNDGATVTYEGQSYQVLGCESSNAQHQYRLHNAVETKTVAVWKLVLTWSGQNALHLAASKGLVSDVRFLCTKMAGHLSDQDNRGSTPLHVASRYGHEVVAELLLDHGADVNQANNDGCTPLHVASEKGHELTALLLLDHGADVNQAGKNGRTPLCAASLKGHESLHFARENGHESTARLLLDHGAAVDQADNSGRTPLYGASRYGHESMAALLLDHGAAVDHADNGDETPLTVAKDDSMVALLILHALVGSRS